MRFVSATVVLAGTALLVWVGCGGSTSSSASPLYDDAGTTTDGAAASSSGSTGSSGNGSPDGGVNPPNAGPGGSTTSITCGATTCGIPATSCCVVELDRGRAFSCAATCDPEAGNGNRDGGGQGGGDHNGGDTIALKCSGAANCASGTVCCIREIDNGATSECKARCERNEEQLCDPAAQTTGCAADAECSTGDVDEFGLPRTYGTCSERDNQQ